MLIKAKDLPIGVPVRGVIHVGAHECEERQAYADVFHLTDAQVIWIDALQEKVDMMLTVPVPAHVPAVHFQCRRCRGGLQCDQQLAVQLLPHAEDAPHPPPDRAQCVAAPRAHPDAQHLLPAARHPRDRLQLPQHGHPGRRAAGPAGRLEILPAMDYVYLEVNREELYEHTGLIADVDSLLQSYGFEQA